MNILLVVDMQNDFISGALGSDHAKAIVSRVQEKISRFAGQLVFTRDTHGADYLTTQEGANLPVPHCIRGSEGWEICSELQPWAEKAMVVDKETFGSMDLPDLLRPLLQAGDTIELCGLCTDICVISNAMIVKAAFPEHKVVVDASCCAGVTPESHETALAAMKAVQISVK